MKGQMKENKGRKKAALFEKSAQKLL